MRSYCALFIDAGYLLAASSIRVTGTSLRSAAETDVGGLLTALTHQVEQDSGLPLLRIQWYDSGTRQGGPAGNQRDIAMLPKVKLRLGRVGLAGEQKGVDLKLALDLITQSRNKAAEIVYLVSGDDDLSEAVEEAQHHGVQVISLVVPDDKGIPIAVSGHLKMTVDQLRLIDGAVVDAHVRRSSAPVRPPVVASPPPVPAPAAPAEPPATPVTHPPSPLDLARLRANRASADLTGGRPVEPVATAGTGGLVYRTVTGGRPAEPGVVDAIDDVVDKVFVNFRRAASAEALADLVKGRPMIPGELDRVLLNDLSHRLQVYEISHDQRVLLRELFWERVTRRDP